MGSAECGVRSSEGGYVRTPGASDWTSDFGLWTLDFGLAPAEDIPAAVFPRPAEKPGPRCLALSQPQRAACPADRSAGLQPAFGDPLTMPGRALAGSALSRLQAGAPALLEPAAEIRCANRVLRSRRLTFPAARRRLGQRRIGFHSRVKKAASIPAVIRLEPLRGHVAGAPRSCVYGQSGAQPPHPASCPPAVPPPASRGDTRREQCPGRADDVRPLACSTRIAWPTPHHFACLIKCLSPLSSGTCGAPGMTGCPRNRADLHGPQQPAANHQGNLPSGRVPSNRNSRCVHRRLKTMVPYLSRRRFPIANMERPSCRASWRVHFWMDPGRRLDRAGALLPASRAAPANRNECRVLAAGLPPPWLCGPETAPRAYRATCPATGLRPASSWALSCRCHGAQAGGA